MELDPRIIEQDRYEWEFAGFTCVVLRHPELGVLMGYVAVPAGHRFYGVSCGEGGFQNIHVHGGIVYTGDCEPMKEPDGRWWIGFDAAHGFDVIPSVAKMADELGIPLYKGTIFRKKWEYKDYMYMREQVELLASQLADAPVGISNGDVEQT